MKIILFFTLALMIFLMARMILLGRALAGHETLKSKLVSLRKHRFTGRLIFWALVIAIVFIESMVRANGGAHRLDALFWFHIYVAIVYLLTVILLNWPFRGQRYNYSINKVHKNIAYICASSFVAVIATAIPIILRL